MAKVQFRSIYGYSLKKTDMERPTGPSMTIVDQTYTIKELVLRAQEGFFPIQSKEGIWAPEEDIDSLDLEKVSQLDLAEKQNIMEQTRDRIKELQEAAEKNKKLVSDLQKKHAEQTEAILLEKLASLQQQKTTTKKE